MDATPFLFWHWWIIAAILLAAEMAILSFFLLWLGVAAIITGSLLWLIPDLSFEIQLLVFAFLSVISVGFWRRYGGLRHTVSDHPLLNRRGSQYMGRMVNLITPIENGLGKVRVDDSIWTVQGEDCPAGTKVKIIAVNGTQFTVERCQ